MGGFVSYLGRNLANDRLPSLWGLWTEDLCRGNGSELPFRKYPLERKGKQQGKLSGSTVHLPKESQYSRKSSSAKLTPACMLSVYKWTSWKECPGHTLVWKQITEKGCRRLCRSQRYCLRPAVPSEAVHSSSPHLVSVQLMEDSRYDSVLSGPNNEISQISYLTIYKITLFWSWMS